MKPTQTCVPPQQTAYINFIDRCIIPASGGNMQVAENGSVGSLSPESIAVRSQGLKWKKKWKKKRKEKKKDPLRPLKS